MNNILIILISSIITCGLAYELFYSPKATISKLWKEIFAISHKIAEQNKNFPNSTLTYEYEKIITKKKAMINSLLDYHFNQEEDEEYITENRP